MRTKRRRGGLVVALMSFKCDELRFYIESSCSLLAKEACSSHRQTREEGALLKALGERPKSLAMYKGCVYTTRVLEFWRCAHRNAKGQGSTERISAR